MSKISSILGADSITVILDGNSYTINKQAHTYDMVLKALREDDVEAMRAAINIRKGITEGLAKSGGNKVRVEGNSIYYCDREVTGLISTRIFEMLRLGLSVKPMIRFLENMMQNPSKRAVDELFGFIDACRLPITEDGHFLAYKRVRHDYLDCYSATMDNSVGKILEMPRNMVDEDKNNTCSYGLHFCSYDYLRHFGGERIMVLKINPRDVVAIPADYNNSKGRTCRYEVVDELPVDQYRMPEYTIKDDYTNDYSSNVWDDPEEWEESDDFGKDDYNNDYSSNVWDDPEEWKESYDFDEEEVETPASDVAAKKASPNGNTTGKLSPSDVKQIRFMLNSGCTLAHIARAFSVHPRTIARIRDGEAWTNV